MFENKTRLLLSLPQSDLDGARVLAGTATTMLKLSVSVQIVLRALIGEGLKRDGEPEPPRKHRGSSARGPPYPEPGR